MRVLQKIINQINADIALHRGNGGDYLDGVVAGLSQAKLIIRREIGQCPAGTMTKKKYAEYLKSDHWQATRKRMLEQALYKCDACEDGKRLGVHHKTYERLGHEEDADLVVLCEMCHKVTHREIDSKALVSGLVEGMK